MERCMNNLKRKVGWRSNLISVVLLCLVGGVVFAYDSSHVDDDLRAQIEALQHEISEREAAAFSAERARAQSDETTALVVAIG